jgi:hypothetical protein
MTAQTERDPGAEKGDKPPGKSDHPRERLEEFLNKRLPQNVPPDLPESESNDQKPERPAKEPDSK